MASEQLEARIPDVHKTGVEPLRGAGNIFVKTHWKYAPSLPMHEQTAAVIYIVRNRVQF